MENRNQKLDFGINPERELSCVREGQMLQFAPDGFRLYEYIETGEEVMRQVKVGETEYFFRVPKKERVLQKTVASLSELFDYDSYNRDDDRFVNITYYSDEFKQWEKNLISPEDIKEAAALELARRETESDQTVILCCFCKGEVQDDFDCSCTLGGVVFGDVTEKEEAPFTPIARERYT